MDTCIIYNPTAGRGRAQAWIDSTCTWAALGADLRPTTGPGVARELARTAALQGYRRVIAAGGDGTVHEVANGLLQSDRRDIVLGVWPIGSSNDYAASLGLGDWWRSQGKTATLTVGSVDVGRVRTARRELWYVNCLGVGFNGMVTREAVGIRSLRGMPLYTLAFLRAMLWRFQTPEMTIRWGETDCRVPTLSASFNLGIREGGFPITSEASLTDGLLDCVHVANLRRWELIRYLPNLMTGRIPRDHAKIRTGKCTRAWVQSSRPICAHADGEFVCVPEDEVHEIEIELVPKRLLVERGVPSAE